MITVDNLLFAYLNGAFTVCIIYYCRCLWEDEPNVRNFFFLGTTVSFLWPIIVLIGLMYCVFSGQRKLVQYFKHRKVCQGKAGRRTHPY